MVEHGFEMHICIFSAHRDLAKLIKMEKSDNNPSPSPNPEIKKPTKPARVTVTQAQKVEAFAGFASGVVVAVFMNLLTKGYVFSSLDLRPQQ
ncbi:hypothetical protein Ocin01_03883 [Orchesella cincta]|uniref:Uncharacterized protein n=1 Tax=Orchesella cincta TaxID=48709 RepID=A0A1D2NC19_ORCCI|nr:hypothetical protein Ocin01_03883 [Orchesella cincta]